MVWLNSFWRLDAQRCPFINCKFWTTKSCLHFSGSLRPRQKLNYNNTIGEMAKRVTKPICERENKPEIIIEEDEPFKSEIVVRNSVTGREAFI